MIPTGAALVALVVNITVDKEGGYSHDPRDKGGETYAGITRKNFPSWVGWRTIDVLKAHGKLSHGKKFPELNAPVHNFYVENFARPLHIAAMDSANVASIIFDWSVHWGIPRTVRRVQNMLILRYNQSIKADGVMGPKTAEAINTVCRNDHTVKMHDGLHIISGALHLTNALSTDRLEFYNNTAADWYRKGFITRGLSFMVVQ